MRKVAPFENGPFYRGHLACVLARPDSRCCKFRPYHSLIIISLSPLIFLLPSQMGNPSEKLTLELPLDRFVPDTSHVGRRVPPLLRADRAFGAVDTFPQRGRGMVYIGDCYAPTR